MLNTLGAEMITLMWSCSTSLSGYKLVLGWTWCWLMEREPFPLEGFCNEVEKALNVGLPYLAAVGALALPDICSSLEWDPAPDKIRDQRRTQQDRYKSWFRQYLKKHYNHFTEDDCYRLRCGVLHNGKLGRPADTYERVAFTIPPRVGPREQHYSNNIIEGIQTGKLLALDLTVFCNLVIGAAREWYENKRNDEFVKANVVTLLRLNPKGVLPFFTGHSALVGNTHEPFDFGDFAMIEIGELPFNRRW
jgi:hypothetical protein